MCFLHLIFIICIQFKISSLCPQHCNCSFNHIECENFQSFSELKFSSSLELIHTMRLNSGGVGTRLSNQLNLTHIKLDPTCFEIKLENLDGIEISENPFKNHTKHTQLLYFHLNNSTFEFFYRNKSFDWLCDLVYLDKNFNSIFASFKNILFGYFSPIYFNNNAVCPVIFRNARIDWLFISSLTAHNRLNFIQLNSQFELNSRIKYLQIQFSNIDILDHYLLDKSVFKHIEKLSIEFSKFFV